MFPCLSLPADSGHLPLDAEICALGLMSGTSLDGVDAAVLTTDGVSVLHPGPALTVPYRESFKDELRGLLGLDPSTDSTQASVVEQVLTQIHVQAVEKLLLQVSNNASSEHKHQPRLIGLHGHTITHAPGRGWTWQLGDGDVLAQKTGLMVVSDFRSADIAAGGQGAPLAPLFHRALSATSSRPVAVLNIGGIANVTWIGPNDDLIAFDSGPGNALIDDWMQGHGLGNYDAGGAVAARGQVHEKALQPLLNQDYFTLPPPKSLDRLAFDHAAVADLSVADGAATLTDFTARAVALSLHHFPKPPRFWLVTGGGRLNAHLMTRLRDLLHVSVEPIESLGWSGDALEAQAFAYLAVRACKGLPLSDPSTTGAARPLSGGRFHYPPSSDTGE